MLETGDCRAVPRGAVDSAERSCPKSAPPQRKGRWQFAKRASLIHSGACPQFSRNNAIVMSAFNKNYRIQETSLFSASYAALFDVVNPAK